MCTSRGAGSGSSSRRTRRRAASASGAAAATAASAGDAFRSHPRITRRDSRVRMMVGRVDGDVRCPSCLEGFLCDICITKKFWTRGEGCGVYMRKQVTVAYIRSFSGV